MDPLTHALQEWLEHPGPPTTQQAMTAVNAWLVSHLDHIVPGLCLSEQDDLAAQCLVGAWRSLDGLARSSQPHGYLRRLVLHRFRSSLRTHGPDLVDPEELDHQVDAGSRDPAAPVHWQELLDSLPGIQRTLVTQRYEEGRTLREVAALHGHSPSWVLHTLRKALAHLVLQDHPNRPRKS